jgi:hypothetical protein
MSEERETFWIVWCPTGSQPPRHQHAGYDQAVREAERLAMSAPGQEFYVMAADTMRIVDNMKRVDFVREMPF